MVRKLDQFKEILRAHFGEQPAQQAATSGPSVGDGGSEREVSKRSRERASGERATHHGRGQGQRDLEDLGVPVEHIRQQGRYLHDAQHESYLTNLPVDALVGAAGGGRAIERATSGRQGRRPRVAAAIAPVNLWDDSD